MDDTRASDVLAVIEPGAADVVELLDSKIASRRDCRSHALPEPSPEAAGTQLLKLAITPLRRLGFLFMRTHGWGGATPTSDEEAVERILDAASAAIEERGAAMRVADVARALEISRQTVYNYFPGNSLLEAVATRSGVRFIQRLRRHLEGITDPVAALVESFAYTLEWLPSDKPTQMMLANDFGRVSVGVTSDTAKQFGHGILAGLDVDWAGLGMDDAGIDDLVEYMLRMLQSFMIDPGDPPRTGDALRDYVRRWLGPVVTSEIARHQG